MSLVSETGARTQAALPALIGGRYTPSGVLGRGGAAVVYRATDQLLRREVAIKLFAGHEAPEVEVRAHEMDVRRATRRARLSHE